MPGDDLAAVAGLHATPKFQQLGWPWASPANDEVHGEQRRNRTQAGACAASG